MAGLYKIYLNRQQQQTSSASDPEKKVSEKKLEKDLYAAQYQLLQDCLDVCNPGTSLGLFSFDDGFIGLAGLGSSLLGLNTYVLGIHSSLLVVNNVVVNGRSALLKVKS